MYDDIHNTVTVPCSFASSVMKSIVVFPARPKFAVKLICCIAFGSVSSAIKYQVLSSNDKTKSLFTSWKLGLIKKSKYWFCCSTVTFGS